MRFIVRLRRSTSIVVGEQRIILDCLEPESMVIYRNTLYHREVRVHIAGYRRSFAKETIWLAVSDRVNLTSHVRAYLKSRFHLHRVLLRNVRVLERVLFPPGRFDFERKVLLPK